eukprot:3627567-Amphidinium_carterae.1
MCIRDSSGPVAMGVYTIRSYEDDAELAKILFREVWGEHVSFPSQEEVHKSGLTVDKLAEKGNSFKLEEDGQESEEEDMPLVPLEDVSGSGPPQMVPLQDQNEQEKKLQKYKRKLADLQAEVAASSAAASSAAASSASSGAATPAAPARPVYIQPLTKGRTMWGPGEKNW